MESEAADGLDEFGTLPVTGTSPKRDDEAAGLTTEGALEERGLGRG